MLCCVVLDRYWPNFVVIFWHQKLQFVTFCCYIDLQEWFYVLSASLFIEWQCVPVFFPDKAVVSMDIRIWHKVASHTACEPSWLHVYSQFMQVILHRQRSCPSRAVIAQLGLFCVNLQFTNGQVAIHGFVLLQVEPWQLTMHHYHIFLIDWLG